MRIFVCFSFMFLSLVLAQTKPQLCFTFDDGNSKNIAGYDFNEINNLILEHLEKDKLQSVLYVCGKMMNNKNGEKVLVSWLNAGHSVGNHTYNHSYYHSKNITVNEFTKDIAKCDSFLCQYSNYIKYFRAPYLKRGNTVNKQKALIKYLSSNNYMNGYVTIDASDWYYNNLLIKSIKKNEKDKILKIKKLYIEHILDRAKYYDNLATDLFHRKIKHSLLLHHNLISAMFLGDLIEELKKDGWELINANSALSDEIYKCEMSSLPAGESIIWNLAKASGNYEGKLRYPAEDSRYEEIKFK